MVTTTTTGLVLWKILVAVAILFVGAALGSWLAGAAATGLERSGLDPVVRRGLTRAVRPVVVLIAVVAALSYLDVDLTIVAAMVGAATLAVGIALRSTLANVASGGLLLTLRPFREGERIACAGEEGVVLEQGTFAVVLERPDGTVVTIPNEVAFGAPIRNHSRRGNRRFELPVVLAHDVDLPAMRAQILETVAAEPRILPMPEPSVDVAGIDRDGVQVVVRGWVLASSHDEVRAALAERLLTVFSGAPRSRQASGPRK